ncbi:MAG TPA: cation:proton antiporter [bacterium]|nr:cation:proton antiporter [bacterium]
MNPVTLFLVSLAGIFLVGSVGEAVFKRTNIPDVVWLIVMGLFVGPVTHLVEARSLGRIAPYFAALTLIIVLFEGGSRLKIREVAQEAHRSLLLALLTFSASVLAVFLVALIPASAGLLPGWTWQHCLLLGTILGGSSSIVIMPTLQQAKIKPGVSNLLNLESAFTDVFCVVGTSALLDLFTSNGGSSPFGALTRSFGLGLFFGLGAGAVWLLALKPLRSINQPYAVTLSFLILLYVLVDRSGGSAALAILAYSVVVGNAGWISRKLKLTEPLGMGEDVRGFHSQLAFFIKSFFFTFIGAMLTPPWGFILFGVLLGFLLLPARYPGAWVSGRGGKLDAGERLLVTASLPRGMAAGVLATMPAAAGMAGTDDLPVIVFACVFTTILIFAVGFPLALKKSAQAAVPVPVPADRTPDDPAA